MGSTGGSQVSQCFWQPHLKRRDPIRISLLSTGAHKQHPTIQPKTSNRNAPSRPCCAVYTWPCRPRQEPSTAEKTTRTSAPSPFATLSLLERVHLSDTDRPRRVDWPSRQSVPIRAKRPWRPNATRPTFTDAIWSNPTARAPSGLPAAPGAREGASCSS